MVVFESVITFLKVNFLLKNRIHAEKYLNHKYMNTTHVPRWSNNIPDTWEYPQRKYNTLVIPLSNEN